MIARAPSTVSRTAAKRVPSGASISLMSHDCAARILVNDLKGFMQIRRPWQATRLRSTRPGAGYDLEEEVVAHIHRRLDPPGRERTP